MNNKNGLYVTNYKLFLACHILFIFTLCLNDCQASCISKEIHLEDSKEITFEGRSDTQISIATIGVSINNSKVIIRNYHDLKVANSFLFKIIAVCNPSKDAMNMFPYHIPAVEPTLICPQNNGLAVKFLVLNSKHTNRYTYHAKVVFNELVINKDSNLASSLSLPQKIGLFSAVVWKRIKSGSSFLYLANKIKNLKKLSILGDFSITNISHFFHHANIKHITTCEKPNSLSNKIQPENRK
jgi:hypothetical protein